MSLVALVALWAFLQSYQKWLDPIVDVGRDLYIPGELLTGRKLYRDIRYIYPPFTPYFLSAITGLFGNGLAIYAALGVAISMAVTGTLYFIARATVHPIAAGIVSLLFVSLNFTGAGFNFIFPYTHAATFGILFFLLYLAFMIVYLFVNRRPFYYALAFTFALLASWTKIEFALAASITLPAILICYKLPPSYYFYSALIACGSLGFAHLYFRDAAATSHWLWSNILAQTLLASPIARVFFARVFGIEQLSDRLIEILTGTLLIAASIGVLAGLDRMAREASFPRSWKKLAILLTLFVTLLFIFWGLADVRFFRAWALLQIVLIPIAVLKERRTPLFLLLLFSILVSLRIYLNLEPTRFGFTLMVPTYLVIAYVFFRYLPERGAYTPKTGLLWLPLFLLIVIRGQSEQYSYYSLKRFSVETAQGVFYDGIRDRATIVQDFLDFLKVSGASELVVLPEGLTWNYFSRTRNPLSFHTFTPPETGFPEIEQQVIEEMETAKPALVAINSRSVSEFGFNAFGADYNRDLMTYLQKYYVLLRAWDAPRFRLILLQRKVTEPADPAPTTSKRK